MVTIATFNDSAKARQLKRRFQDAGLRADVHNEAPLQQVGFMSRPQANAKVMVEDADFEKAQNLMVEWEATDPDISAALVRCPQCSSSNIEYPQMTRKFMTPVLLPGLPFYLEQPGRADDRTALASLLSRERIWDRGLLGKTDFSAGD